MVSDLAQVGRITLLEAITRANAGRKRIRPNSEFNRMLLQTDEWKGFSWPNHTGTGFAIEATGKPFGKTIEKEFIYIEGKKVLIYYVREEDIGATNIMHLFEHQFRQDGESTIQLVNAKTDKQILAVEELQDAREIILKVTGDIRNFRLICRDGQVFETPETRIHASDDSAIGLLRRGISPTGSDRERIYAYHLLHDRCGALYQATGTQISAEERGQPKQVPIALPAELKQIISEAKLEIAQFGAGALHQTRNLIAMIESLCNGRQF